MEWWVVAVVVLLALAVPVGLFARRRWLSRHSGMFDMAVRPHSEVEGGNWALGLARYHEGELQWFRVFSLSWRPRRRFRQGEWELTSTRPVGQPEENLLYAGNRVAHLQPRAGGEELDLAMERPALTGFASWLEAAGPGRVRYGNTAE